MVGTFDVDAVVRLARHFKDSNLSAQGPPAPPWGDSPSVSAFESVLQGNPGVLPSIYGTAFLDPVQKNTAKILASVEQLKNEGEPAEAILGPIYQRHPDCEVRAQLNRFQIVVDTLYQSFLADEKRARLNLPLASQLSPLASFKSQGNLGPFTLPADWLGPLVGTGVGVVSLPSSYRDHLLLWPALAHETGGHDILHADPALLEEMKERVQGFFEGGAPLAFWGGQALGAPALERRKLAVLWQHWIDESASDVLGVLNCGPAFCVSFSAFLSAFRATAEPARFPRLMTTLPGGRNPLDTHPIDILRIYLCMGVISGLDSLAPAARSWYLNFAGRLALVLGGSTQPVVVQGTIAEAPPDLQEFDLVLPMPIMAASAFAVGFLLATAELESLQCHTLQDLETWSTGDERLACRIAALMLQGREQLPGSAAHILSGATLACLQVPEKITEVCRMTERGMDRLYARSAIWNPPMEGSKNVS